MAAIFTLDIPYCWLAIDLNFDDINVNDWLIGMEHDFNYSKVLQKFFSNSFVSNVLNTSKFSQNILSSKMLLEISCEKASFAYVV